MHHDPHHEHHFTAQDTVKDIVIGMADGLTVPFALAAGLTGAIAQSSLVITAGFAEIAAGSVAMGLGGYLAARTERNHYLAEREREKWEVHHKRQVELNEVQEIFEYYGLSPDEAQKVTNALAQDEEKWIDFMMRFELGLEEPDPKRALTSGLTIATAYIVGGFVPLLPYFFFEQSNEGLRYSALITLVALILFGYFKAKATGTNPIAGAVQTVLVGGIAATVAFLLASLLA